MAEAGKRDERSPSSARGEERRYRSWVLLVLIPLVCVLGWRATNYCSGVRPGVDTGAFASAAYHMSEGRTLYREVWDHKPPMIHLLNLGALTLGDGTFASVRAMERWFSVFRLLAFFTLLLLVFRNPWLAALFTAAFLVVFHYPRLLEGGNGTEEYAASFAIGGILNAVLAVRCRRELHALPAAAGSGLLFSLAALTKEPFVLTSLPWLVWLVCRAEGRRRKIRTALAFIGGAVVVPAIVAAGLARLGALGDWWDVLMFNVSYSGTPPVPLSGRLLTNFDRISDLFVYPWTSITIACLIGLAGLFHRTFQRSLSFFPLVAACAVLVDATELMLVGNRFYGHYYLQMAPSLCLLAACGGAFLWYLASERTVAIRVVAALLLVVTPLALDWPELRSSWQRIQAPFLTCSLSPVARHILATTADDSLIWSPTGPTSLYLDARRLSPVRYIYLHPHLLVNTPQSSGLEKKKQLRADLVRNPPEAIVLSRRGDRPFYGGIGGRRFTRWLEANYRATDVDGFIVLHRIRPDQPPRSTSR